VPAITLHAGDYAATFRPDAAMLCTSLQYAGEEYVAWPRSMMQYRAGKATAIPLLHPWANRLPQWGYRFADTTVDLHGMHLPLDTNGVPIHGNLFAAPFELTAEDTAFVSAQLDYAADAERLRAFPFPHLVAVDARLDAVHGLTIGTQVWATSDVAVPISFGWHPFVRLPAGGRSTWQLRWPACEHVEVDERIVPTGARTQQAASREPIGRRTFDDHYALGADRTFSIATTQHSLELTFGDTYPFAMLFVPPRRQFVAIEPMTAEVDALGQGTAPSCAPGDTFRAEFRIRVTR
jgi:aldose 1-epimerase